MFLDEEAAPMAVDDDADDDDAEAEDALTAAATSNAPEAEADEASIPIHVRRNTQTRRTQRHCEHRQ